MQALILFLHMVVEIVQEAFNSVKNIKKVELVSVSKTKCHIINVYSNVYG